MAGEYLPGYSAGDMAGRARCKRHGLHAAGPGTTHSGEAVEQSSDDLLAERPVDGPVWVIRTVEVHQDITTSLDMRKGVVELSPNCSSRQALNAARPSTGRSMTQAKVVLIVVLGFSLF